MDKSELNFANLEGGSHQAVSVAVFPLGGNVIPWLPQFGNKHGCAVLT